MKLRFVINPHSGRQGRNAGILGLLRDFISARSLWSAV